MEILRVSGAASEEDRGSVWLHARLRHPILASRTLLGYGPVARTLITGDGNSPRGS